MNDAEIRMECLKLAERIAALRGDNVDAMLSHAKAMYEWIVDHPSAPLKKVA